MNCLSPPKCIENQDDLVRRVSAFADLAALKHDMATHGYVPTLRLDGDASSFAEIFIDDGGDRAIYMAPGATAQTEPAHVREHADFIARAAHLTTEGSQLPLASALEALQIARSQGAVTVVDLDVPPSDAVASGLGDMRELDAVLRAADWLKPSKSAAQELVPEQARLTEG